jgi:two-component system cell cycle response regulator
VVAAKNLDRRADRGDELQQAHESLEHQLERAVLRGHEPSPLCLIMSDLDFFKKINDTCGHMIGDLVLRHLARRIKFATRDFDIIGRFGGEEFVVIMADTGPELAKTIAERIRTGVMSAPFHVKNLTSALPSARAWQC